MDPDTRRTPVGGRPGFVESSVGHWRRGAHHTATVELHDSIRSSAIADNIVVISASLIDSWADKIRPHLVSAVENIIGAGTELIAAKEALPHGQFLPLLAELSLSPRVAQMFMNVARHPILGNAIHVSHLPTSLRTLDELTRVPDDELEEAIEAGEITPSTTRKQACAIKREVRPSTTVRRRSPLPDAAERAAWEFRRAAERVQRILDDDRLEANREAVAAQLRPHLVFIFNVVLDVDDVVKGIVRGEAVLR